MDQATPQTIGSLLMIGIALAIGIGGFISWCNRVDGRPAYDPLRDGPVDYGRGVAPAEDDWEGLNLAGPVPPIAAAQHLPASLRRPLPVHRNMEGAAQADIADLKRGTSDNLKGLLP